MRYLLSAFFQNPSFVANFLLRTVANLRTICLVMMFILPVPRYVQGGEKHASNIQASPLLVGLERPQAANLTVSDSNSLQGTAMAIRQHLSFSIFNVHIATWFMLLQLFGVFDL